MKVFLGYFLSFCYLLCASLCGCREDTGYEYVDYQAELPNVLSIDGDRKSFSVNDTLWVNINIPNIVTSTENKEVNINSLTGSSEGYFVFELLKLGDFDNPSLVVLSEKELVEDVGTLYMGTSDTALTEVLFPINETAFRARFGVVLKESGDFIMRNYSDNKISFYFGDDNYEDNVIYSVIVNSSFRSSIVPQQYAFMVE
jgi:hypothetical protein